MLIDPTLLAGGRSDCACERTFADQGIDFDGSSGDGIDGFGHGFSIRGAIDPAREVVRQCNDVRHADAWILQALAWRGSKKLTGDAIFAKVTLKAVFQHTNLQAMVKIHFLVANRDARTVESCHSKRRRYSGSEMCSNSMRIEVHGER